MMKGVISWVACASLVASVLSATAMGETGQPSSLSPSEQQFVSSMVKDGYSKPKVTAIVRQIQYTPDVIKKMTQPYESLSWKQYRAHFITASRIEGGVHYASQKSDALKQAQQRYGVDPNVITAILGVETLYGKYTGTYKVLDSLGTLAFHYPPRARFFQKELKEFIALSIQNDLPISELKGSYAGALGIPQFMPSSYLHYGVQAHETKQPIDLFNDHQDAIASVGNYLAKAGWQRGQPVACRLNATSRISDRSVSSSAKDKHSLSWYKTNRVPVCGNHLPSNTQAALINLGTAKQPEYWMVFNNFSAIMRYNPRINYAMAVYQLSEAIGRSHG